jgi:hypothetical protein
MRARRAKAWAVRLAARPALQRLASSSVSTNWTFARPRGIVASAVGMTRLTVGRWRQRFVVQRVDGLLDEPRPGAPRTVTDAAVEATHWSTRAMAKRSRLSQTHLRQYGAGLRGVAQDKYAVLQETVSRRR